MNTTVKAWLHSLFAAAIGGSASALGAVIISPDSFNWTTTGWSKLGEVALVGAIVPVLALLKQSPLPATASNTTDGTTHLGLGILLVIGLGLLVTPARAQDVQNVYAGGASYNINASPSVSGTAIYAHEIMGTGTYAFTAVDALPTTIKPFTVTTNIGVGVAQRIVTIGSIPIYVPTTAGISWSGTNTGWQWNGGGLAMIHLKGNYYLMPSVRFLKSSVSSGSGYQPILGVLLGWGK